ncbi:MAG: hypothetical protein HN368_18565 [Spirochaetales bacterium]|jgi:hypothetical protein|nr:hypothetical protein [Spirochaetales bacterium]
MNREDLERLTILIGKGFRESIFSAATRYGVTATDFVKVALVEAYEKYGYYPTPPGETRLAFWQTQAKIPYFDGDREKIETIEKGRISKSDEVTARLKLREIHQQILDETGIDLHLEAIERKRKERKDATRKKELGDAFESGLLPVDFRETAQQFQAYSWLTMYHDGKASKEDFDEIIGYLKRDKENGSFWNKDTDSSEAD